MANFGWKRRLMMLAGLGIILASLVSCRAKGTTPTSKTVSPTPTTQTVTINITAQNLSFDKSTITVPDGSTVKVVLNNKDNGISHNFAVYQNVTGGGTKPVFVSTPLTGPATGTFTFTAPAAGGSYFFQCDFHPKQMNGTFVVTPGAPPTSTTVPPTDLPK